jgi:hypothetical protein
MPSNMDIPTNEIRWHPVLETYGAAPDGRVYSRSLGEIRLMSPSPAPGGYRRFEFNVKGKRFRYRGGRFVLEVFVGPCPEGMECCHGLKGPSVDSLDNLRWDTRRENSIDRLLYGVKPAWIKLNPESAAEIRALKGTGVTKAELAERYGVGREAIKRIWNRGIWDHSRPAPAR